MADQDEFSLRIKAIAQTASVCVSRWGIVLSPEFSSQVNMADVSQAIQTALRQAAAKALEFEFVQAYPDDHGWSGGSLRGVTHRRVAEISAKPDSIDSDIYGVVAIAQAGDQGLVIPLVTDLDESSSQAALDMVESDILSHIDSVSVAEILDSENFSLSVVAGNWKTLAQLIDHSVLTLDDALWLRKPGAWDLIRGSLSGLPCPPLPKMNDNEFSSRFFRSIRFSEVEINSAKEMIRVLADKKLEFLTPKWVTWFERMVENINLIGPPKAFEGLSVVLAFAYEEVVTDDPLRWHALSTHHLCVACGLDPVGAGFVSELARQDPIEFHDLIPQAESRYRPLGVLVIPDVELARYRVSVVGRRSVAYDRLLAFTHADDDKTA